MNPLLAALVQAGIITADEAERMNRALDPEAARLWAEQRLVLAVQNGLSEQQRRVLELLRRTNGTPTAAALDAFWRAEDDALWAIMQPTLDAIAAERAISIAVARAGGADTWQTVNQRVLDWMHGYYTSADPAFVGSVPNLNQTAREAVADAFAKWQRGELEGGQGLPDLIAELQRNEAFGAVRAERIAVTETTRIDSEAVIAAAQADENTTHLMWHTANDELVCEICGPLNNQTVRKGGRFRFEGGGDGVPPAHVNCRCTLSEETAETMRIPVRNA